MPAVAVPVGAILQGPGTLYTAVLGTSLPGSGAGGVVAGSKFTDAWGASWVLVGATRSGSQFRWKVNAAGVYVAEYLDPLLYSTTDREIGVAFDMSQTTLASFAIGLNGGTTTTVSGTGPTTLSKYGPPVVGAEVRRMIGWESNDSTVRIFWYQNFQSGELVMSNAKAPEFASLPVSFLTEQPASGDPFNIFTAGTVRVG